MSAVGAGCREYMQPQNATMIGTDNPREPVTLTCEPVSTMAEAMVEWRKFTSTNQMEEYINTCSGSSCCRRSSIAAIRSDVNFTVVDYNLTIMQPEMNHAWFVPSFVIRNCTYIAPGTYLYRKLI